MPEVLNWIGGIFTFILLATSVNAFMIYECYKEKTRDYAFYGPFSFLFTVLCGLASLIWWVVLPLFMLGGLWVTVWYIGINKICPLAESFFKDKE